MKNKFALIRSKDDGTFEFVPGIEGADYKVPESKEEEYTSFYDIDNQLTGITYSQLIKSIIAFFNGGSCE